ncbi:MAG: SDR family NAD(P)-dependent oxidoreductase [Gammaproteobacteria bacterium]|nr:SDR family NAD(P)-dependent oxidoreductase [Gammaproteobacteria bacterium]
MKTAVITGAASGLGKAIAIHYSKHGWQVIVADINQLAGNNVVDDINNNGGNALFYYCDIGKPESFRSLAQFTEEKSGQCHLLVNNAGVASAGTLMESDEDEWQRLINLDLMSCVRGSKTFIPLLKVSASKSNPTTIVNIASLAGIAQMPEMIAYNVVKAGVIALSESLRSELVKDYIHVAVVCPSFFKTNLTNSMISSDEATINKVNTWMEKSELTAESVALDIAKGIIQRKNIILCDKKVKPYFALIGWIYSKILKK